MSKLFLSHSSHDNAAAVALRDWMQSEGFGDVFLDTDPKRGITAGERWERALHEAARRCEAVLFLVSRAWLASDWCHKEFNLAHRLNKRLFGVLIEDIPVAELPVNLTSTWQLVNLASGRDHLLLTAVVPVTHEQVHVTFSAEGLIRLRTGLRRAGLDPTMFAWPPIDEPKRTPYPGLRPLEAEDAGIYFGREAQIIEALDGIRALRAGTAPRLLCILGSSGSGKSSFLRAGLWPRLGRDDGHFLPLPVLRPERAALTGKTGLLSTLEAAAEAGGLRLTRAAIREAINEGANSLRALLSQIRDTGARPAAEEEAIGTAGRPLLVLPIDQGEELFLGDGAQEGGALLDLLRDLLVEDDPALIVVLTIRSDTFERLQLAPALEGIALQTMTFGPMPRGIYGTIIDGPASRMRDAERPLVIEPALTRALLDDLEMGGGRDALPLLAFTLQRLWREYGGSGRLALADYEQLGRVRGSIEAGIQEVLRQADTDPRLPHERGAQLALLRRGLIPWLAGIDPDTGTPRRRVARRSEIPAEAAPLIDLLIEARLLSTDADATGEATVEPAHEALLRQWGLLQGWLEEDFAALAALEGVGRAAREWEANARGEAWLAHGGERLAEAERLLERPDLAAQIKASARDYLAASKDRVKQEIARDRQRNRHRRVAIGTILICSTIAGLLSLNILRQRDKILAASTAEAATLASRLLENGVDYSTALANIASISNKSYEKRYDHVLSYWLPSFRTLEDTLKGVPNYSVARFFDRTIVKAKNTIATYSSGKVTEFFNDPQNGRFAIADDKDRITFYDWDDFSLVNSFKFIEIDTDSEDSKSNVKTIIDSSILDEIKLFSIGKRFTVGIGSTQASYAGGVEKRFFVLDQRLNVAHVIGAQEINLDYNDKTCKGPIISVDYYREMSFNEDTGLEFRNKSGENIQNLCTNYELENQFAEVLIDTVSKSQKIQAGTVADVDKNQSENHQMRQVEFPSLLSEKEEWVVKKIQDLEKEIKKNTPADSDSIEKFLVSEERIRWDLHGNIRPKTLYSHDKHFKALDKNWSLEPRSLVGDEKEAYFPLEAGSLFEADLGSDKLFISRHGAGKWVAVDMCRLDSYGNGEKCLTVSDASAVETWISPRARTAIIGGTRYMGGRTMHVIDLDSMEEDRKFNSPPSTIIGASIADDRSRISVTTCDGELWIYKTALAEPVRVVPLGRSRSSLSDKCAAVNINNNPLRVDINGGISLINGLSGDPIWVSRPLPSKVEYAIASDDGSVILVSDSSGWMRLLDAATGISLSRSVQISQICGVVRDKVLAKDFVRLLDGRPGFLCGDGVIVRRSPATADELANILKNRSYLFVSPDNIGPELLNFVVNLADPPRESSEVLKAIQDKALRDKDRENESENAKEKVVVETDNINVPQLDDAFVGPIGSQKRRFIWPLKARIIAQFGVRGNEGINLAVPEGSSVRAAAEGVVAYAGSDLKGYGALVLLRHPDGYVTAYAHNNSISVKVGDKVLQGQMIALSGATGNVTSPQLHFEIRRNAGALNPMSFLKGVD